MKINTIYFKNFTLAALFQFIADVIKTIKRLDAEKLKIAPQFNRLLLPAFKKYDDAYKKEKKSILTDKITETDKARDKIISGIKGIVRAMLNDIDEENVDAAKELKILLDTYKRITKKSIKEECADITNILQEFKGKYAEAVNKLNLSKWINELERLNIEINSYINARNEETANKYKTDIKQAKKDVIAAYRTVCKQIEVHVSTEGSANYADFIRNLNAIISKYSRY